MSPGTRQRAAGGRGLRIAPASRFMSAVLGGLAGLCAVVPALASPGEVFRVCTNGVVLPQKVPDGGRRLVRYEFALPGTPPAERSLENKGLPIATTSWESNGIRYTQIVLVTRLGAGDLMPKGRLPADWVLIVQLLGQNTASEYRDASAGLAIQSANGWLNLQVDEGLVRLDRTNTSPVVAAVEMPGGGSAASAEGRLHFQGNMPPGTTGFMTIKIPSTPLESKDRVELLRNLEYDEELQRVKRYWSASTNRPAEIMLPIALVPLVK